MNRDNLRLETILLACIVVPIISNFYSPSFPGAPVLYGCLYGAGALQIFHSIYIGVARWNESLIRGWLLLYWLLVVADCTLVSFLWPEHTDTRVDVLIGPRYCLALAVLIWFINFRFRRRSAIDPRKLVVR